MNQTQPQQPIPTPPITPISPKKTTRPSWTILIILAIIAIAINAYAVWRGQKEEPIKEKDLTIEMIKNAEYVSAYIGADKIQLTNGKSDILVPGCTIPGTCFIEIREIVFGDLDSDEIEDAAIILASSAGGTGVFKELAVVINQDGEAQYLASEKLGDRVVINSISIQSGEVVVDMFVHGPDDPMVNPTQEKISKYKISGDQLIELIEDETADWQVYRNEKYGFEIKHPHKYIVPSITPGDIFAIEFYPEKGEKISDFTLTVVPNEKKLSINEYLTDLYDFSDLRLKGFKTYGIFTLKPAKNQTDEYYEKFGPLGSGLEYHYWFVGNEDWIFSLSHNQAAGILDSLADQILSTFRFIKADETAIKVYSPKFGDVWEIGKTYEVKWDSAVFGTDTVYLALVDKEGGGVCAIDAVPNTGSYLFTVPKKTGFGSCMGPIIPGDKYYVNLSTNAVSMRSQIFSVKGVEDEIE